MQVQPLNNGVAFNGSAMKNGQQMISVGQNNNLDLASYFGDYSTNALDKTSHRNLFEDFIYHTFRDVNTKNAFELIVKLLISFGTLELVPKIGKSVSKSKNLDIAKEKFGKVQEKLNKFKDNKLLQKADKYLEDYFEAGISKPQELFTNITGIDTKDRSFALGLGWVGAEFLLRFLRQTSLYSWLNLSEDQNVAKENDKRNTNLMNLAIDVILKFGSALALSDTIEKRIKGPLGKIIGLSTGFIYGEFVSKFEQWLETTVTSFLKTNIPFFNKPKETEKKDDWSFVDALSQAISFKLLVFCKLVLVGLFIKKAHHFHALATRDVSNNQVKTTMLHIKNFIGLQLVKSNPEFSDKSTHLRNIDNFAEWLKKVQPEIDALPIPAPIKNIYKKYINFVRFNVKYVYGSPNWANALEQKGVNKSEIALAIGKDSLSAIGIKFVLSLCLIPVLVSANYINHLLQPFIDTVSESFKSIFPSRKKDEQKQLIMKLNN
jgi:hypothetical protein